MALLVFASGIASVAGCSRIGSPIVAGAQHLGIGWFVEREPLVARTNEPTSSDPVYIDVEGIGFLVTPGRCSIGYSRSSYAAIRPDDDYHVQLSDLNIFTGQAAEAYARDAVRVEPLEPVDAFPRISEEQNP